MKSNWNYPTSIWVGENDTDLVACKDIKKKPLFVIIKIFKDL